MKTIVDTDALLGISNPDDAHYDAAINLLKRCSSQRADIYLLPTTLAEFALMATSRIGMEKTKQAVERVRAMASVFLLADEPLTTDALHRYQQQTSKEESLFDCYVMAAADIWKVDCIFSFDRGYTKNGFVIAEDFFRNALLHK